MTTAVSITVLLAATLFAIVLLGVGLTCANQVQSNFFTRLARVRALRFLSGICFAASCPVVGSSCIGFLKDTWPKIWIDPEMFLLNLAMVPFLIFFCFALTAFPALVAYSCFTYKPTSAPEAPSQ